MLSLAIEQNRVLHRVAREAAVIESEYCMKGSPVMVPEWVMPTCEPSCPCQMDSELVQEAADFLLRMGMLQVSDGGYLRTNF